MSKVILTDARSHTRAANPSGGVTAVFRPGGLSFLGVIVTRCEVALAVLFLWAAYNKLFISASAPQLFSASVEAFKLNLPDPLVRLSTSVVPWVEVVAGVMLLLGIWSRGAALVLSLLLMVFIALIVQALARGLNVECGCFGKLSPFCSGPLGACNIIQNLVMLAAGLIIAATPRDRLVK